MSPAVFGSEATFDSFGAIRACVVGDVMLDEYWWGSVDRVSPEAPVPVLLQGRRSVALGGAGNVAANVAALGADVIVISEIGDDDAGRELSDLFHTQGIAAELSCVRSVTTTKVRMYADGQQLLRVDREDVSAAPSTGGIELAVRRAVATANVILLSDYAKGTLPEGTCREVLRIAASSGVPAFVDPKGRDFDRYRGAAVLTPNLRELEVLTGRQLASDDEVALAAGEIRKSLSIKAVVVTRGADGMTLVSAHGTHHARASVHEVFDVVGAGDTVLAVLALATSAGMSLEDATDLASVAAGHVVSRVGARTVTRDLLRSGTANTTM